MAGSRSHPDVRRGRRARRLGVQLLHRTACKLGLTDAGKIYNQHCQSIARDLDEAESAVGQLQGGPRGCLRFSASHDIGIEWPCGAGCNTATR